MLDEHSLLTPRLPEDPKTRARAAALLDCYRRIDAEVMRELPVSNPALGVEVVGLRPWGQGWLGVLVTPWMMSYVRLAGEGETEPALETGAKITERFPAGPCELVLERQPELGWYLLCPLYSPMGGFETPLHARATATVALDLLLTAPQPEAAAPSPERGPAKPTPGFSRRALLARRHA